MPADQTLYLHELPDLRNIFRFNIKPSPTTLPSIVFGYLKALESSLLSATLSVRAEDEV